MKHYKGYLIDLDGTIYEGNRKIEDAIYFVNNLKELNIPYLFLTNNSARTREAVAKKLSTMGIHTKKEDVLTSGVATANYIEENHPDAKLYIIGEQGLKEALQEKNFIITEEDPDIVVMGIDREITYEKITKACIAVSSGAKFISTNPDLVVPTDLGMLPGNGLMTSIISRSTGVEPLFIGKPESTIIHQALKILGTNKDNTIIVGDNYNTDVLSGIRYGMDTLLVHTGVTEKDDLKNYDTQPTYSLDSLKQWELLRQKQKL